MNILKKIINLLFNNKSKNEDTHNIVVNNIVGSDIIINGNKVSANNKKMESSLHKLELKTFKQLKNNTVFKVLVLANNNEKQNIIEYTMPEEIAEKISFNNKNNKLSIETNGNISGCFESSIVIYTDLNIIEKIINTSVGGINVNGDINNIKMELSSSSTGGISLNSLICGDLEINNSGTGKIKIKDGKVNKSNFEITSTGNVEVKNLVIVDATIKSSSVGSLECRILNKIEGKLTSVGSAFIFGKPKNVLIESTSIGKVKFK